MRNGFFQERMQLTHARATREIPAVFQKVPDHAMAEKVRRRAFGADGFGGLSFSDGHFAWAAFECF